MTAPTENAVPRHKLLLLDDDPEVLEVYQEVLLQLPSQPEVHIATSGARALALLEAQPFTMLVSDLKMPKMDGLQVLAIVRRKFPYLRTVVLTGVVDEQLRSRAYSMGIDLFLQKPGNNKEVTFLLDCIESLLGQEVTGGFRGVQSKSLVDIIQLECLSGSSSVLKISNGKLEGRIWIQNGELIDAASGSLTGEEAFKQIMGWKGGSFETLPAEPARPRRIKTSYQGLLLDSAQSLDEAQAVPAAASAPEAGERADRGAPLGQMRGVEFALRIPSSQGGLEHWGLEDAEKLAAWAKRTAEEFERVGDELRFGTLEALQASGMQRHMQIVPAPGGGYVVAGMVGSPNRAEIQETMGKLLEKWGS